MDKDKKTLVQRVEKLEKEIESTKHQVGFLIPICIRRILEKKS
ncbi:hypothetical protein ACIR03_02445 [Clostridium cochlearium]